MSLGAFKDSILHPQSKCLSLSKNNPNDQKERLWLNRGKKAIISKKYILQNTEVISKGAEQKMHKKCDK